MSELAVLAAVAASGLALAVSQLDAGQPEPAPMSESEVRVEQCMAAGGNEERCIYEEMKRTMLPASS